ncbi:MAG: class I SAM-dependent methyltransferase [Bryobacterales bacterium]|nr:class I SAM-dependent methyltransferase [Bryobacterales bacterium]
MRSAGVQQLDALSDLFADAVERCRPESVAILGIAGGNGLERIDGNITRRVAGLDVNPLYLEAVRRRFAATYDLELHCVDLAEETAKLEPVHLVHAALVFEHAGVGRCLENALSLVAPGGALSAVLQLPGESGASVGASAFPSIQSLGSHFSLIEPTWFREELAHRGFRLKHQSRRALPSGKGFWMGVFGRA